MKPEDVIEIYELLTSNGIDVWLDGGWGIDALLGEQTRLHEDVDIIVQEKDLPKLRELLTAQGYKDVERDDTSAWNFVLSDSKGHLIDIHAFTYDNEGNGLYGNHGLTFPAPSFKGTGKIKDKAVKCISAEQIVEFVSPWLYKRREKNINDISALCKKFNIPYPPELKKVIKSQNSRVK